jgi:DNA (cytosine-5)-methyltransferase 1
MCKLFSKYFQNFCNVGVFIIFAGMEEKTYNYRWRLSETHFTKDKGKVFSCFACGGGSTMGYKLAGFDVLGCNEIDPKMMEAYKINHNPKYSFLEPIQTFKDRNDLPEELYNLDILDGSPPCSSFSMAGNREKDWGKEKKFKEGQAKQVLDTLFFDFIDLAKKLQPKVVIAENVKGLLLGSAKSYVREIYREFDKAGYIVQHWLLNASKMGVPQRRERVFFIALRKDLAKPFLQYKDFFTYAPELNLEFNNIEIPFKEFDTGLKGRELPEFIGKYYDLVEIGQKVSKALKKNNLREILFSYDKVNPNNPLKTITANKDSGEFRHDSKNFIHENDFVLGGSFPEDYNFKNFNKKYLIGMSVPPVMTARIAQRVYDQWLSKI